MKITFITNYYNHHQSAFADALDRMTDHSFTFVSTGKMRDDRRKLGYGNWEEPDFVIDASCREQEKERAKKAIAESDVLIIGSAPKEFFMPFVSDEKTVFYCTERQFKRGIPYLKLPAYFVKWHHRFSRKNTYLLAASAYACSDYAMLGLFRNKAYKWGYFPQVRTYDMEELLSRKDKTKILWCGRLIDWKHPDAVIRLAERLRDRGQGFSIDMIGFGEMEVQLRQMIQEKGLENYVHLLGAMSPETVRAHMEQAGIFAFTSDYQEGWGAVLNEAMNSACAVVASDATGSAPYLISDRNDGMLYHFDDEEGLFRSVRMFLNDSLEQENFGRRAYKKIVSEWNAEVAADRLLTLIDALKNEKDTSSLFEGGPCSRC